MLAKILSEACSLARPFSAVGHYLTHGPGARTCNGGVDGLDAQGEGLKDVGEALAVRVVEVHRERGRGDRVPRAGVPEASVCEVCGQADRIDQILLCDGPGAWWRLEWFSPPVHCSDGVVGDASAPVERWWWQGIF